MTDGALTLHQVTLSTKCWEGDYRDVLTPAGLSKLFSSFGPAERRQVVINRVSDRRRAERMAQSLIDAELLDTFAFAEDSWPEVAAFLHIPLTWFGAAWPYSAPELVELFLAQTPVLAHVAGDVAVDVGFDWLPRALTGLVSAPAAVVASPLSPSGREADGRTPDSHGWITTHAFSDQCFVARRFDLLAPDVVRAVHWTSGRYPKPGGALTFEARVGAWLQVTGKTRATDVTRRYVHPVHGDEGASYANAMQVLLPPIQLAGSAYPPAGSVDATGLVIVRNGERTIAAAVASLRWCRRVVVVDQSSEDRTVARAHAAGAEVVSSEVTGVVEPARRKAIDMLEPGWVIMLDADEVLPAPLAQKLADVVRSDGPHAGVRIARKNMLFGRWARGAGWWPDPQLRAFRQEAVVLPTETIHGAIKLAAGFESFDLVPQAGGDPNLAILHFNYTGYADWFDRMNHYTTVQSASTTIRRSRPGLQFMRAFLKRYLRQGGWRLGRYGFDISVLGASYDWLLVNKAAELAAGGSVALAAVYDEMAQATLDAGR